jgi:hypothetical protein
MTDDQRIAALMAQLIANARMPRDLDVLLNPDWVVVPRDVVEQLEDLFAARLTPSEPG